MKDKKDLTPVAAVISDYAALAVRADSDYENFDQVAEALPAMMLVTFAVLVARVLRERRSATARG